MVENFKHALSQLWMILKKLWTLDTLSIIIALLIFVLVLLNVFPAILRPISFKVRTGFAGFLPLFILSLYISFRLPGSLGRFFSITLTFLFFALALAGLWETGQSQSNLFNGIVPLHDASNYYIDALRLTLGQDFSSFSARRPLFSGLLAVLLTITNRNLMISLGILTAIAAGSCYLAAKEIQRTHGAEVAVFVLAIIFLFYRYHIGIPMTENLGVALGVLGFALLWRGASNLNQFIVWMGLFISTLALNARAGAFFVLPLLLLWGTWIFRVPGKSLSWQFFIGGLGAICGGFLINWLAFRLLAAQSGILFANFSYSLYGLASGGKYWYYVFNSHPELLKLQDPYQSTMIYKLAFEQIIQNPGLMVQGIFINWRTFFSNSMYGVYSYVSAENEAVNPIIYWGLYLLCILGVYNCLSKLSDPVSSLLLVSVLGLLVSVPFLPPGDAYRLRAYAASIIILALLPALGLAFILEQISTKVGFFLKSDSNPSSYTGLVWFSLILTLILVIGPYIVKHIGIPPQLHPTTCNVGMDSIVTRFDPGTYFNVVSESSSVPDQMPNFHLFVYKHNSHGLADQDMINWAIKIEPPVSIIDVLDYRSYGNDLLVSPSDLLTNPGALVEVCGHWETDPKLAQYNIFYAKSINILSP